MRRSHVVRREGPDGYQGGHGPRVVEPVGAAVAGIRLRPGTAGAVLGLPASEVCDQHVDASFLWGEQGARLGELMADAEPSGRLGMLAEAVLP